MKILFLRDLSLNNQNYFKYNPLFFNYKCLVMWSRYLQWNTYFDSIDYKKKKDAIC